MDIQAWGAFGELVGAIGVVISVIYLANQVKDAGRTAQVQAHQGVTQSGVKLMEMLAENAEAWSSGHSDPESLAPGQRVKFHSVLYAWLFIVVDLWHARANGAFDESILRRWVGGLAAALNTPGGSAWWSEARRSTIPEVAAAIDTARDRLRPLTEVHPGWFPSLPGAQGGAADDSTQITL